MSRNVFLRIVPLAVGALLTIATANSQQSAMSPEATTPLEIKDAAGRPLGLFRRVLSRADAKVLADAQGTAVVVESPEPFTSYYVFAERGPPAERFIQIGPTTSGALGWLKQSESIDWPSNIVLALNPRVNRDPVLFFSDLSGLGDLLSNEATIVAKSGELTAAARAGKLRSYRGVLAMEPDDVPHWRDKFYLMPVLGFQKPDDKLSDGPDHVLMRTAAIPVAPDDVDARCRKPNNVAVVFVIDTTISMAPYIERTRETIGKMVQDLRGAPKGERVRFGLVGYRSDPKGRAGVEYLTREFLALDSTSDVARMQQAIAKVTAARGSTATFDEDALAGVLHAADFNWQDYQSRWIVLVTDAGLQRPSDVQGVSTKLWDELNIGVVALHLKTLEGVNNHDQAAEQLKSLARWKHVESPYLAIEGGNLQQFGTEVDRRTSQMVELVDKDLAELQQAALRNDPIAKIGLAQRLIWLGNCSESGPPDIVEAWAVNTAIGPNVSRFGSPKAFEPRLLLNRLQMDQLYRVLTAIVESAEATREQPELFFDRVSTTLSTAALDPKLLPGLIADERAMLQSKQGFRSLGELLPSYSELIPFKSPFATITQEQWMGMPIVEKERHLQEIKAKIAILARYFKQAENWQSLHPSIQAGDLEQVFPVLLDNLP